MISNFIFGEGTGLTYEQLQRQRALAEQLAASGPGKISTVGEGINSAAHSISAALINRRADKADQKNREAHAAEWDEAISGVGSLFGGGAPAVSSSSPAPSNPAPSYTPPVDPADPTANRFPIGQTGPAPEREAYPIGEPVEPTPGADLAPLIAETAESIGMDPADLATIISYETAGTFDPTKAGPTTQHGQHRGLIQFGEPQARQYGVDWNDPVRSQLGPDGAIARYFKENGWQPGMGMLDAYSIVNAGGPGLYNRSDANNGGAPGTVADKVNNQMAGHREKAQRILASLDRGPAPDGFAIAPGQQPMPQQPAPQQLPPDNVVASLSPQPGGTMTDAAPPGAIPQQQPPVQMAQAQPAMPPQPPQGAPQGFQLQGSGMDRAFSEMQQAGQPMPGAPQPRPQQPAPQQPQRPQQPVTATQGQQGPTQAIVMQLLELASSPYASDSQKAIAQMLVQQYQQQNDPLRQVQMERERLELEQMRNPQRDTVTVGDRLIDRQSGEVIADFSQPDAPETEWVDGVGLINSATGETIRPADNPQGGGPFTGNSVEAQALNGLVQSGVITRQQAQEMAAGKTVTGPQGEIIFLTPSGVFARDQRTGQTVEVVPQGGAPVQQGQPAPTQPQGTPQQGAPAPEQPAQTQTPGQIQVTDPSESTTTRAGREKVQSALTALENELDRYVELVDKNGFAVAPGVERNQISTVRRGIQMQMKELYNLGVLNGPDLELMEEMIYDPTVRGGMGLFNIPGQAASALGLTDSPVEQAKASRDELLRMMRNMVAAQSGIDVGDQPDPPPDEDKPGDLIGGVRTAPSDAPPDFLSADDKEIWPWATPEERQAIAESYR